MEKSPFLANKPVQFYFFSFSFESCYLQQQLSRLLNYRDVEGLQGLVI